ncbi:MAG: hypothetical protein FWH55_13355 [Oscillospiraceae bacterium]|nr:hypothetical protein [Oscillospiraceae bacterium]
MNMKTKVLDKIISMVLAIVLTTALIAPAASAAPSGPTVIAIQDPVDSFIAAQKELLDEPDIEYWPATRWWLAEGLHTDATIKKDVKQLYEMGIGSIEIVCMPENNVSSNSDTPADIDRNIWPTQTNKEIYSWGSEEWRHDTALVIQETTKYGMGFAMTSGTHWANANLPEEFLAPDDDAAGKSLGYHITVVSGGTPYSGNLTRSSKSGYGVVRQDLVAVVAVKLDASSTATLTANGAIAATNNERLMVYEDNPIVLTNLVKRDGVAVTPETMKDPTGAAVFTLDWTPPDNSVYHLFTFWMQATGQSPTPSAGRNFTINYIDPYGMDEFIDYYDNQIFIGELRDTIKQNGRGEMYMDSLEISATNGQTGLFWGYTLVDEFKERRGYDITPYLPYMIKEGSRISETRHPVKIAGNFAKTEKIRNDLYETMTDMYIENVLVPLKTYLNNEMNMKLRAEITYGVTYEISTPAIGVNYVETESLEFRNQLDSHRTLAGAAHVFGIRYSSETGAGSPNNYMYQQDHFLRIINTQYASGISHTVFHGYSSIEGADSWVQGTTTRAGTAWPGHEGMSVGQSERYGPRQPAFRFYDDYMPMLARSQAILQQGKPQIDLAVMRTDYTFNNGPDGQNTRFDHLRTRKTVYLKDLALQDAGYTYDYFAPENLEKLEQEGIAEYREGEGLIPDNVGYQALILYQDEIRVESAQKILDLAKKGLPVIIVNGLTENRTAGVNRQPPSIYKTHPKACVYSLGNDGRDDELKNIMDEMKALTNVIELSPEGLPDNPVNPDPDDIGWYEPGFVSYEDKYFTGKTGILEALQDLGVRPRAEFSEPKQDFLTFTRRTDNEIYLFVYNFMDKQDYWHNPMPSAKRDTVNISIDGAGKPYSYDVWTKDMAELGEYEIESNRTSFDVTLEPGATAYFILNLDDTGSGIHAISTDADKALLTKGWMSLRATESGTYTTELSNGDTIIKEITAPANVNLTNWNLAVEDWNEGEKKYIYENRGLGYTTKEVYFETLKTLIDVGPTALIPWKDIPAVGQSVSGLGFYTTKFNLPSDWSDNNGAYVKIDSVGGNLAAVYINGEKAKGFDFVSGEVDVSELLKPGENDIRVEVSTSLRNRLKQRNHSNARNFAYDDYGMMGEAKLVTYALTPIMPEVKASIRADEATVGINAPASYTVSLSEAKGVGVITLSFTADGRYLDLYEAIALNGFSIVEPLAWEYAGAQRWKGTIKLYCAGFVQNNDPLDVLKINGAARDLLGDTTVILTDFAVTGDVHGYSGAMPGVIKTADAAISIVTKTVFSKYDLNHDGKIDELDLAIVVYYYLANDLEADWDVVKFDIASAKDCDVALNGRVDLADIIEVIANYCDSY